MAEKFDPKHADKLENPERLVELPPAKLVELLVPLDDVRALLTGAGLAEFALYAPGSIGPYRNVIVAQKPHP